jgi:hypothetical protein
MCWTVLGQCGSLVGEIQDSGSSFLKVVFLRVTAVGGSVYPSYPSMTHILFNPCSCVFL